MDARMKAALAAFAVAAALPGTASASDVSLSAGTLDYEAGAEANDLFIGSPVVNQVFVSDAPGVVITPGVGCTNPDNDNTATCIGSLDDLEINTEAGNDTIDASSPSLGVLTGGPLLDGGDDDDVIRGSLGDDFLLGQEGDDILEGGDGGDALYGDYGHDLASYQSETDPVTVTLAQGGGGDGVAGEDEANADGTVEGVIGGSGDDVMTGTGGAEEFHGHLGGDIINAGGGADDVYGGGGEDTILAGGGTDFVTGDGGRGAGPPAYDELDGGPQEDRVSYGDRAVPVTVDLATVEGNGAAGEDDQLTAFENAVGGQADDTLRGSNGANELDGGAGDDTIIGREGDDEFSGGSGSDTVSHAARAVAIEVDLAAGGGNAGAEDEEYTGIENVVGGFADDTLSGDDGANTINGLGGDDTIAGDGGADLLQGGSETDSIKGGGDADTIYGDAGTDTVDGGAGEDSLRMRDSEADNVDCGDEFDTAIVDPVDTLVGCDSADNGVAPEPVEIERFVEVQVPVQVPVEVPVPVTTFVPTPVPGAAPPEPPADTTRPRIELARLSSTQRLSSFRRGLKVRVGCNEPCSFEVELFASTRTVKLARSYDLRLVTRSLSRASGTRSLTLKPSGRLIRGHRRLAVQLRITAVDAAGNKTTLTRTLRVR